MKLLCKKCGHGFYFDDAIYLAAEYSQTNWRCPKCQNIVLTEKTRMTIPEGQTDYFYEGASVDISAYRYNPETATWFERYLRRRKEKKLQRWLARH